MITIAGSSFVLTDKVVMTHLAATPSVLGQVSTLRQGIADASRLRYSLLHENAHLLLTSTSSLTLDCSPNHTGMTTVMESAWWLAELIRTDASLTGAFDETPATAPWSRRIGAPVDMTAYAQSSDKRYCPPVLRTFRMLVLPPENKAALVRLLGGILAALSLILILVLTALTRHPNVLTLVLVMLAACLHFGRRGEPDDHGSLPMRRNQTSWGSCLHG